MVSKGAAAAIVTGASSGIGAALARLLAREGHALVLVARRADALEALAGAIAAEGIARPLVVVLDLAEPGAAEALKARVAAAGLSCALLVNNAGFGLAGRVDELGHEQIGLLRLNIESLSAVTLAFLPDLIAARGAILNVASVAAFLPGPGMAAYYASKAYVRSFSEALHQEMKDKGVTVTALCPGPVATGFQARAGVDFPGPAMDADAVARAGLRALRQGRRGVVPGWRNKLLVLAAALAPRALLLPAVARFQSRRRR